MPDKKNIVVDLKTEQLPSVADSIKEMLKEGYTINVMLYNQVKSGKRKGEWDPITRIQLRAWK